MGDDMLVEFRLKLIEAQQKDHDLRMRNLEKLAAKVVICACIGSIIGGALVTAFVGQFFHG